MMTMMMVTARMRTPTTSSGHVPKPGSMMRLQASHTPSVYVVEVSSRPSSNAMSRTSCTTLPPETEMMTATATSASTWYLSVPILESTRYHRRRMP